eukprot:gnl/Chilomastix_caulleri/537.p1 GENE.gnl/Chilomastix_caulleri/537~~gnl/Chilomastix_caulleri/537.p1  ORF type:complete len:143 (+),score=38.68 gnl/Chilomastix_caulleri/537:40-429(+)
MSAKALKCKDLVTKTVPELTKLLGEYKKELLELRIAKVTSRIPQKLSRLSVVRHDVARLNTVLCAKAREDAIKTFKGKKYVPKDLRARKTRAIRRALSTRQQNLKSVRVMKRQAKYPMRLYALNSKGKK